MEHIAIIGSFVVFLLGLWTISYLYYLRKEFYYEFISTFLGIVIIHSVMMIWDLARYYISVNITTDDAVFQSSFWGQASQPIISYLTVVVDLLVVKLLFQLSEIKVHLLVRKIGFSVFILYTLSYLIRITAIYSDSDLIPLRDVHWHIHVVVSNLALLILLYFIIQNFLGEKKSRKPVNGVCSLFYLTFFLLCTFPIISVNPWYIYYMVFLMSLFNLFPYIWVKFLFIPQNLQSTRLNSLNDSLNSILLDKKISKREVEIIELILEGKSNREIEEKLFISVNTVKNHLYRIYKKLGVGSRGQLMNLIIEKQSKQMK